MIKKMPHRYNSIIIVLHWVMSLAFFMMLSSGIYMGYFDIEKSLQFQIYQWHKSGGVLLLIAIVLRLIVKLATKAPPLPSSFKKIEITSAKLGHYALYIAMITMVSSGWIMVSSSVYGLPTIVFGWFEWPHIPNIAGNETMSYLSKEIHFYGFITFIILILGHIGAVILHYKKEKVNLVNRIWWRKTKVLILAIAIGTTSAAHAETLPIDTANSSLTFTGEHAGNVFEGTFNIWTGNIDLESKAIQASFDATSISTGNKMYDGTLPTGDWFNSKNYPKITFKSTSVEKISEIEYKVLGDFKIKDISKPLIFMLHITQEDQTSLQGNLSFTINRLDYELGKKSDPTAEWVSQDIAIHLTFKAD